MMVNTRPQHRMKAAMKDLQEREARSSSSLHEHATDILCTYVQLLSVKGEEVRDQHKFTVRNHSPNRGKVVLNFLTTNQDLLKLA